MTTFARTKIAEMARIVTTMQLKPTAEVVRKGCCDIRFILLMLNNEANAEIERKRGAA